MNTIELVVFDMAGTVVNEDNVVYKSLLKAINQHGHNLDLDFVLEHGAGKEKFQAIKDILSLLGDGLDLTEAKAIFGDFKILLDQAYQDLEVRTFPGVEMLLEKLRAAGIKTALNTGYDTATATLLVKKMGWKHGVHYDALITADDVQRGRPHPDMIWEAMKATGVTQAEKVLKAGDSAIDIEEGKNAGCGITVGVTSGAQTEAQLREAGPTYILGSVAELDKILLED